MTYAIATCSEYFNRLAFNELQRHHPHLSSIEQLSPQHRYIRNPGSFDTLTKPWRKKTPIYVHHLYPVHEVIALRGTPTDFDGMRMVAQRMVSADATLQVRILGDYPYSATTVTQSLRPKQLTQPVHNPQGRVLSVLINGEQAYMGVSWASQNVSPSPVPHFDEPVSNRAGFKLLEALATFNIRLHADGHALDLGAAPGAWTEILLRRGLQVTAVAPDTLYDWLLDDPNVRFCHQTAEAYLPQCDTIYDLIVNDMRMDVRDSARLMVEYAQHLRPSGIALMTLKLYMSNPQRLMDHTFRILRRTYKIIYVRQLVHNRKEVTLFLRKKFPKMQ